LEICWIGEFSRRKNPFAALEVAQHLMEDEIPFSLAMVGDGPLHSEVAKEVERRGMHGSVHLAGRTNVVPVLTRAHVVIHTARWEGLPRVLLEANAVGRPVVAFDVKGVRDIPSIDLVREGDTRSMAQCAIGRSTIEPVLPPHDLFSSVRSARTIKAFVDEIVA
jgi:glycosyltransferase involved in cell wall biosynthesis